MKQKTTGQKGFSLIEIITAIVVVGILALLVVSVSDKARSMAQGSRCTGNLRATGMASLSYFNDNEGNLLPTSSWDVYASWNGKEKGMRDYLGIETDVVNVTNNKSFFYDTVLTCQAMQQANPGIRMVLHRTFSINQFLYQRDPSSTYRNLPIEERPYLKDAPRQLSGIRDTAKMWMFTDASRDKAGTIYVGSVPSVVYEEFMTFPHEGKNNFVFVDGHVESLSREEFKQRAGDNAFWGKTN